MLDDSVRGYAIPSRDQHEVAHNDLGRIHQRSNPIPEDGYPRREQGTKPFGCPICTTLLDEREKGVDHDDDDDGNAKLG